jgi:hypothetical protein
VLDAFERSEQHLSIEKISLARRIAAQLMHEFNRPAPMEPKDALERAAVQRRRR